MSTAETVNTNQTASPDSAFDLGDVDALLSQADALMNDVQVSLGDQNTSTAAATTPTDTSSESSYEAEHARTEGVIHEMAEEITASAEDADADAIMALLNGQTSGEPDKDATSKPAVLGGPQSAPKDWLDEATSTDDLLPSIPDSESTSNHVSEAAVTHVANSTKRLAHLLSTVLQILIRLPLSVLILIDRPFARLTPQTKSFIGYAAISTFVVAAATWFYGDIRQPY